MKQLIAGDSVLYKGKQGTIIWIGRYGITIKIELVDTGEIVTTELDNGDVTTMGGEPYVK